MAKRKSKRSRKSSPRSSHDLSRRRPGDFDRRREMELFRLVEKQLERDNPFGTWDLNERIKSYERDPFTGQKKYKKIDGTQAPKETRAIVARQSATPEVPEHYHVQTHQYFVDPLRTVVCHARKLRRRIMFALGLTRRGSAHGRKHNFTDTSTIRCK